MEYSIILPQYPDCTPEVAELFFHPGGTPSTHRIYFYAIAIEERDCNFTVQPVVGKLKHPEDGEIRFYQLIQVQWRRKHQGIVYPSGNDSGHILRDGHSFTVH